ncbi:uncharacterized protein MKK02DRAFT_31286 [Dioszegia hungarica]|uniref:AB hydrolase-1 domain-containing protein n=1 Tax=Dioszegia hungarica TaxID=4972 RepID=A0AA38HH96_9TREE|nr:uncharacterized protein MKK02DRAFT_31286 [Dioszegia hungarica]KAI9639024.1 hypothetical protein MKK02DRAFT_31286 [Dioszegia hungarica]
MSAKSRSSASTRPSTPPAGARSPTEVTSLLPPSSHTPTSASPTASGSFNKSHARKASVGGRSVSGRSTAGSVRGYGATAKPVVPGPAEQAPRVSKAGQRRILTTWPLQIIFGLLTVFTFISLVLTLVLFANTALDLSSISLPYRGSGFAEFWVSAVGSWIGLGGVFFFSHPSYLFFLTTLLTTLIAIPFILVTLFSPPVYAIHDPLLLVPFVLTACCLVFTLLSNYLVRRARYKESQRIVRMLTDAAGRERAVGEEGTARALVGIQGSMWGRFVGFMSGIGGFIAGLAGLIIMTLLLIDMSITAYDYSLPLPSSSSKLVTARATGSAWPIQIHLACVPFPHNSSLPTILYESPSGIPGSLALFDHPVLETSASSRSYPGSWLFEMQQNGTVGKVCIWDRPGYGFSQILPGAELGLVADTLYTSLKSSGNIGKDEKLVLVGEGYGGLVSRTFASTHPNHIAGLVHIEAQTASTYFSESPYGRGWFTLTTHRLATRLLPSLLTPLSLRRLPSAIFRHSSSLSRILASTLERTEGLNENLEKARLQETFSAHSHTSASFRTLLERGYRYPRKAPAVVVSSQEHMDGNAVWAEGQRGLAEEVTAEEGLVGWLKVKKGGKRVCEGKEGREVCEEAVRMVLGKSGKGSGKGGKGKKVV